MEINSQPSADSSPKTRASHDARLQTATQLGDAFADGALDAQEHEKRVESAWAASYTGELAALTVDLPGPRQEVVAQAQQNSDVREWLNEWRWWFGGAVIMSAVWGVQAIRSEPDFFWPLAPLGIWAAILVAAAIWPPPDRRRPPSPPL